jgi:hypothetical protein
MQQFLIEKMVQETKVVILYYAPLVDQQNSTALSASIGNTHPR